VIAARDVTLTDMLGFVGLSESDAMRTWFDSHVTAASAHGGRWRTQFDAQTVRNIDARYRDICARLVDSGVMIPHGD
jgi:hypothetical protein